MCFFRQKTAFDVATGCWSSGVCSSELGGGGGEREREGGEREGRGEIEREGRERESVRE